MPESASRCDYFVSYNHRDEDWAVWVASVFEEAGKTTIIQAWDFQAGSNFVLEMQRAAAGSDRTVIVLSPNYLQSEYTQPEWAAALAQDPIGEQRKLVPIRVAPCEPEGLLKQIVYIDLVGEENADAAARKLVAALQPGRSRPLGRPDFPGAAQAQTTTPHQQASSVAPVAALTWEPLETWPMIHWRDSVVRSSSHAAFELHLVPAVEQRLEVRRLAALPEELITIGRQRGVFSPSEQVNSQSSDQTAYAFVDDPRDKSTGLIVGRSGQRGAWFTLPYDGLGSVLDPDDVRPRIEAFLELLASLQLPEPETVGIGFALGPLLMVTTGSANMIGHRNSASMAFTTSGDITEPPTESVQFHALAAHTSDVADEIVARLQAAMGNV